MPFVFSQTTIRVCFLNSICQATTKMIDSTVIPRNLFCEVFFFFTCKRNVAFLKIFDPYLGPKQIHMVLKVANGQNYHALHILREFNIYTF